MEILLAPAGDSRLLQELAGQWWRDAETTTCSPTFPTKTRGSWARFDQFPNVIRPKLCRRALQ